MTEIYKDKVRYSEVDKMGRAYNAHYLTWFELGRTDLFTKKGLPYSEIENVKGLFLPVRESYVRYKIPLLYNEDYSVHTKCMIIDRFRIRFDYTLRNSKDRVSALGHTIHVFIDENSNMIEIPDFFKAAIYSEA